VINSTTIGDTQYVFTPDPIAFPCATQQTLTITVNSTPSVTVNSPSVCQGATATVTATPVILGSYSYSWNVPSGVINPGNTTSFSTNVAGNYSVIITNTVSGCTSTSASGAVTVFQVPSVTVNSTPGLQGTTVLVTAVPSSNGSFTYTWNVPSGVLNPGNVSSFSTSTSGIYSVIITDNLTGCVSTSSQTIADINNVILIDYPHYFTPNGDGIHDYWNIKGFENDFTAKIYIFDRYGC